MNLTLEINRHQDDGRDFLADSWVILRNHRLIRIFDMRDLDQADDRAAQIDEETERVVTWHDACYGSSARET